MSSEHLQTLNFLHCLEVFGNSLEIFRRCRDVSGNLGHDKVKISGIDSEKVGAV